MHRVPLIVVTVMLAMLFAAPRGGLAQDGSPVATEDRPLLVAVLPAESLPPGAERYAALWAGTLAPGGRLARDPAADAGRGVGFVAVLAGELTVRATRPVARPGESPAAGLDTTLRAGEAAVFPADTLVELANTGRSDVDLVGGGVFGILDTAAMPDSQEGYAIGGYAEGGSGAPLPDGDVLMLLERATLAAGDGIAAAPGEHLVVIGATAEAGGLHVSALDGSVTNQGTEPVAVFVLRLSAPGAATPIAISS